MHFQLCPITPHRFRAEPRRAHETRDPAPAHEPARVPQELVQPWAAVAFLVRSKKTFDLLLEEAVLLRMGTLTATTPGIEAGRRHSVAPAQRRYAEVRAFGVDEGELVAFRAEQNRMAFLRNSTSERGCGSNDLEAKLARAAFQVVDDALLVPRFVVIDPGIDVLHAEAKRIVE